MHIALLAIHSSPLASLGGKEAGGMNVYVRELAHALRQRGLSADIFTRRHAPHLPAVQPLAAGVRLVHVSAGPPAPYDKNRILDHLDDIVQYIADFAAPRPYQLIHSHYWVSGPVALALRERWQVPVVQMFHTLGALKNQVARGTEETETSRRIELERHLLHSVDVTVAATPLDREQMVQHYAADPARIVVVPPGVDTDLFQPASRESARARLGLPASAPLLLSVGRMEPLKGMDTLIEALALLRARQPVPFADLAVLLVGGAPETRPEAWNSEQQRLADLRARLGVAGAVTFAGATDHANLRSYYRAADVYVLASRYESFGMAALEALACGTPVVASNAGGPAILIQPEQSGLLVPPADAPALAEALERLLLDAALHRTLSEGGRQRASQYDWTQIAEQICRVYDASIEAYSSKESAR